MALQINRAIELTDIIGIRLTCKNCSCVVVVPTKHFNTYATTQCPTCQQDWSGDRLSGGTTVAPIIENLVRTMTGLINVLEFKSKEGLALSVGLEIRENPVVPATPKGE